MGKDWASATVGTMVNVSNAFTGLASFTAQVGQTGVTTYGGRVGLKSYQLKRLLAGVLMSILARVAKIEFLTSLRTDWRRLYLNELALILKEHDTCDDKEPEPIVLIAPLHDWRKSRQANNHKET